MSHYAPPLRDMQFVIEELLDASTLLVAMPAHAEVDADLIQHILSAAGRFAAEVLFPLNASGDREGCRFEHGAVQTPNGFAAAYAQFCAAAWPALSCAPEHGGQGLPAMLQCAVFEMLSAANHGWTMYVGLQHGAYACLSRYADAPLQARYLPHIVSGKWLPTMCLTEAHAGSDLGLLRTRATAQADGSYHISGSKIFISGGEQDWTDNIVHLVLARLPQAPVGSKGLSLFLVPKYLPDGSRNHVACTGIEHKLGIRGSATCSMQFDAAQGWLIGTAQRGLSAMFVMMNAARLHVGVQGLGLADAAYQQALAYARTRVQSRSIAGPHNPLTAADPIIGHPAVQRLLMKQRSYIEGGRMLAYWAALMLDLAQHHPDAAMQSLMHERLGFITPVIKAMLSEQGFQGASDALQVFGGHGYISETGIEQYLRDARITMIYEGSNEIQALDFMLRKVQGKNGMQDFLAQIELTTHSLHISVHSGELTPYAQQLQSLVTRLRQATLAIAAATDARLAYLIAPEMLRVTGHAALAWLWLRAAVLAHKNLAQDGRFYQSKIDTACYYFDFVLPEVEQLLHVIDTCVRHSATSSTFPSDYHAA